MQNTNRPPYFPMMIDLSGRKVLIAGGGLVASRRADTLIRCGAEIVAVSPKFCASFPVAAVKIARSFRPEDITADLALVIAATNDRSVNHNIHIIARTLHIPVNIADCQQECDFFFPSLVNAGNVAVSVSTAGISPSLTRRLSDRLRKVWSMWITEENDRKLR